MGIRQSRHLGQMGHTQHLLVAGKGPELFRNPLRRSTGNAGVHLIENQCAYLVFLRQNILHGKHNPGQLTAGSHLTQRLHCFAGIGRQIKHYRIRPVVRQFRFPEAAGKPHSRHIQLTEFGENFGRHKLRFFLPVLPQGQRRIPGKLLLLAQLLFEPFHPVIRKLNFIQFFPGLLQIG